MPVFYMQREIGSASIFVLRAWMYCSKIESDPIPLIPRDIGAGLGAGFFRKLTKPIKVYEFMEAPDVALEYAENEVSQSK